MLTNTFAKSPSINVSGWMRAVMRKTIPKIGTERSEEDFRNDLERLALTAPHLLQDIGFERDVEASAQEKVVWRRGKYCVTICRSSETASVSA